MLLALGYGLYRWFGRRCLILLAGKSSKWQISELFEDDVPVEVLVVKKATKEDELEIFDYEAGVLITAISDGVLFEAAERKFIVPEEVEIFTFREGERTMMARKLK